MTSPNDSFIQDIESESQKRFITLRLLNNTFRCDCDKLYFVRWFLTTNVTIEDKDTVWCSYRGGREIKTEAVNINDLERYYKILIIILATTLPIGVVTLVTWVLCFRFRWHL